MNALKPPLLYEEQINKLKEHNMNIECQDFAIEVLSRTNYYRLSGYALQQRTSTSNSDYISGTSFERTYKIYCFDCMLRSFLRKYIEIVEIYFRTQISYNFAIAKCTNPPHDQHYDANNFYNKVGYKEVMANFSRDKKYYHDSLIMQHHLQNYEGKLPLWVMVEMLSFSNLSKLYACMYNSEQAAIASAVGSGANTLKNHLHCLAVLRNKCAHAARLYNTDFNPPAKFNTSFLRKHPEIHSTTLFAYILVLWKRLPDKKTQSLFKTELQAIIDEYSEYIDFECIGFPQNYLEFFE